MNPPSRLLADLHAEATTVYNGLLLQGRSPDAHFLKAFAARLSQLGFFLSASTKEILQEFNCGVDIVAWKASSAQAVAIVVETGFADDRICDLDGFQPRISIPGAPPVAKVFIALNLDGGLRTGDSSAMAAFFGMRPTASLPSAVTASGQDAPEEPF